MNVSDLIALLSKLPPDMELRKLNSKDDYKVEGSRDMGFKVVNGVLYHIYDLPTDPTGEYLEDYVPVKTIDVEPDIEFGTVTDEDTSEVKPKRKRGV